MHFRLSQMNRMRRKWEKENQKSDCGRGVALISRIFMDRGYGRRLVVAVIVSMIMIVIVGRGSWVRIERKGRGTRTPRSDAEITGTSRTWLVRSGVR